MAYINPKLDYKEGDILYGSDLNASNLVIKRGVDDNYDKIKDIEVFNTELDTNITNLEGALEENVNALEQSIADNVTALEQSIADNLEKIEAVERFTTDLESDINTLASGATPIATKHTRGFVQVGDNLNVDINGVISGKDPYVLPIATDNVIGGVSIGANIDTDGNGKISVKGVRGSDNISVVEQDGNYHIAYTGGNFKKEIVEELPPVGKDDVIYLLKKDTASGSDIYDEYLWIDGVWNPIGSTDVDLANYYDKATVDEKLDAKADKGDVGGKEVFVSSTQPSDTSMQIWIDESEDGSTFDPTSFYKKEETDELLEELDTTLTEYVDTAISELDLDLPIASSEVLGGIKVGKNLEIDAEGILSSLNDKVLPVYENTTDGYMYLSNLPDGVFVIAGPKWKNNPLTTFDLITYDSANAFRLIIKRKNRGFYLEKDGTGYLGCNYLTEVSSDYTGAGTSNTYRLYQPVKNLTTTTSGKPLDATQGKVLKDLIDDLQSQLGIATTETLGIIKVGENLNITEDGILSGLANGAMVLTEDVVTQLNMEYYDSTTSRNFYPVTVALKYGCGIYRIDVDANLCTSQNASKGSISKGDIMIVFNQGKDILFFVSPVTSSHYSALITLHTNSTISTSITYTMNSTHNSDMANWFTKFTSLNKVLTTDNTTSFTPSNNYHPAHKKYVDDAINNLQTQINNLPTGGGGEVNYITAIHSEKDKFIEDLEVGKLYYLTGNWYYKKDNATGSSDVNFSGGYIGYVTEPYTNDFRFEGICFESAFGIKTIEILDIYGSPSSMYGKVREPADNLTTDYGDIALSARQGMVLNDKITTLENKTKTLGENFIDSSSITLTESFENFSEIDVYLHNEDKTIEEKVTIVNPRQSYLAYEKVISHVDLGVFYMLEYFINYDSTTTLSVTGNTGKAIDDTVTTVTSADMPTLYIGKVVGR